MPYGFDMRSLRKHVVNTDLTQVEAGMLQAQRIIRETLRIARYIYDLLQHTVYHPAIEVHPRTAAGRIDNQCFGSRTGNYWIA